MQALKILIAVKEYLTFEYFCNFISFIKNIFRVICT